MRKDYEKSLYIVDMNNGFVNTGLMANPKYNDLVPEQLRFIEKFRCEGELINFILEAHKKDSKEFKTYPIHCLEGSMESMLIPELIDEQNKENTKTYYKNSINGMLNRNLQDDIKDLKKLREIIIGGVCADLCVMDFALTLLRYLDEINKDTLVFVVKSMIDTFDSPEHNREEWLNIAYKVLKQAGAIIVNDYEELKSYEKKLVLDGRQI